MLCPDGRTISRGTHPPDPDGTRIFIQPVIAASHVDAP
jgi:hypothetical protein